MQRGFHRAFNIAFCVKGSCAGSQASVWAVILTFDLITWDGICFCFFLCTWRCVCLYWGSCQGLVAGAFRASVRRDQELPRCQTEPVTGGSNTAPPLAEAEPMGDTAVTSVITHLRKGRKAVQHHLGDNNEKNVRNSHPDPRSVEEVVWVSE